MPWTQSKGYDTFLPGKVTGSPLNACSAHNTRVLSLNAFASQSLHSLLYTLYIPVSPRRRPPSLRRWLCGPLLPSLRSQVGDFIDASAVPDPHDLTLWLTVNGEEKQRASTDLMIFKIDHLIESVSAVMTLEPGDMICTGTPAGVGPAAPGDTIRAGIDGLCEIEFPVIARPPT